MKHILKITLAMFFILISPFSGAQTATPSQPLKFKLIILGTRYFSDVDVMKKGLSRSPYAARIVPSEISQRHLEYEGTLAGPAESFIADITGLSQNRFDVESRYDRDNILVVTLRKIQTLLAPEAPAAPQ